MDQAYWEVKNEARLIPTRKHVCDYIITPSKELGLDIRRPIITLAQVQGQLTHDRVLNGGLRSHSQQLTQNAFVVTDVTDLKPAGTPAMTPGPERHQHDQRLSDLLATMVTGTQLVLVDVIC